jgi:hypothetical protein
MLNETDIAELIKKALAEKIPNWEKDYCANICKKLQVHTKGLLFSKVDTLFPNEAPESKNHCVNTYEPITKGSAGKAISNITRIFTNSGFSVSASDNTLEFINEETFEGENIFSFFVKNWIKKGIETDPNALCACYPKEYTDTYGGSIICFINHEFLKANTKDYILFVSEHESEKEYSLVDSVVKKEVFYDANINNINSKSVVEKTYNQQVKCTIKKEILHLFTADFLIRLELINSKYEYEIFEFDSEIKSIPAFALSAVPLFNKINESFLEPFIPFANLCLLQHRNHRAVDLMFSYPRMSEIQTSCDNIGCSDGQVQDLKDPSIQHSCSRCKGSGFLTVQSPYKTYQKRIDTGLTDPEMMKLLLGADPVKFHTPDTSILNYSKDSWMDYLQKAEEAIFIQQKQATGNVESFKSKEIDKEAEYAWYQNIAKALNTDLKKAIQSFECFLNTSPITVALEQPISLAIVTESEAFTTLDSILAGDAPVFLKAQHVDNFISKFISKSNPVVKAVKVLKAIDPLFFYNNKELQNFKSNNIISVDAWAIHVYSYSVLMQMYDADKMLFDKEEKTIITDVLAAIKLLVPVQSVSLKDKLLVA